MLGGVFMKRSLQLALSLTLLLAVAAFGCASSSATNTQDDSGVHQADAQKDVGTPQQDSSFQDDAAAQDDGAVQQDGNTQQDGQLDAQHDGIVQQDAQTDGPITLRNISGTSIAHYIWDNGTGDVPDDLSGAVITAYVLNGSTYATYAGTGTASGTFTIPNVPSGAYFLFVGSSTGGYYYRMTTDTPNLDYYLRGRTDVVSTTSTTNLVFSVTNMSAYQQGSDDVIYYASNTDAYDDIAYSGTQPTSGATTLSKTYDLNAGSKVLATTADHPILINYVMANTGAGGAATAKRSFSPTPYAQTNGNSANVTGAFANITTTETTSVNWLRSEFHAGTTMTDIAPSAALTAEYSILTAQPGGLTHGIYCSGMDLAQLYGDTTTADVNFGNVTYGDPFDSTWGHYFFTVMAASFTVTASGATTAATVYGWVRTMETRASSMSLHALVSPPKALKVNNQAATANLTAVGTTPTLSWTAPTTGTVNTYQVYVYRVSNNSGTTTRTAVAAFYTDQTSVIMPANVMTAGNSYQFRVMAISEPNSSFATAPWLSTLPHGDATAFTLLVSP
jgi:hypothetical protein